MDVLLARQYELLRCLDANRGGRKSDVGSSDPFGNSKKAMMGACCQTAASRSSQLEAVRVTFCVQATAKWGASRSSPASCCSMARPYAAGAVLVV